MKENKVREWKGREEKKGNFMLFLIFFLKVKRKYLGKNDHIYNMRKRQLEDIFEFSYLSITHFFIYRIPSYHTKHQSFTLF